MSLNYHERIKTLSDLACSLCKKFEMNPYAISLYPNRMEINIQGNYLSNIEEKLTSNGYKLIRQFDSHEKLFKDFAKNIDGIEVEFTLVINKFK